MKKSMLEKIKEVFNSFASVIKRINNSVDSAENAKNSGNEELDTAFTNAYLNGENSFSASSKNSQSQVQPKKPTNHTASRPSYQHANDDRQLEDR